MTTSTQNQAPELDNRELSDDELAGVSGGNKIIEFIVGYIATKVLDAASGPADPGAGWAPSIRGPMKQIQGRQ